MSGYDWRDDPTFEGIEDPEPTRTARTGQDGPCRPTQEDIQAFCEMSERGAFLPTLKGPGLTPPARKRRGKWGNAK
jgi:hypothetical protein